MVGHMITTQGHILEDLRKMEIEVVARGDTNILFHLSIQLILIDRIKIAHKKEPKLKNIVEEVKSSCPELKVADDGVLWLRQQFLYQLMRSERMR